MARPAMKPMRGAALRRIVDGAASRLRVLAASRRERAEAVAAESADWLAFDTSDEGERLRRYELACGRALIRTLNLVLKVKKDSEGQLHPDPAEPGRSETVASTPLVEAPAVIHAPQVDPIPGPIDASPSTEDGNIAMPKVPSASPLPIDEATGSDSSQPVTGGNARKHEFDETNLSTGPVTVLTTPISRERTGPARCSEPILGDEDTAVARDPGLRRFGGC